MLPARGRYPAPNTRRRTDREWPRVRAPRRHAQSEEGASCRNRRGSTGPTEEGGQFTAIGASIETAPKPIADRSKTDADQLVLPTTLAAGALVIWYLVFLQYTPLGVSTGQAALMRGPRLLGDLVIPMSVWGYMPAAMLVGAGLSHQLNPRTHRGLGFRVLGFRV